MDSYATSMYTYATCINTYVHLFNLFNVCFPGVKESVTVSNVLGFVNVTVALFIILGGITFCNMDNWSVPDGFTPFGTISIFRGSARAYFAFIGYEF